MTLKDRIKGCGSPLPQKNSPINSNSLSISSKNIDIILWYFRTRNADDKSCQLLRQITGSNGNYTDISSVFKEEMEEFIDELREKVNSLNIKDDYIHVNFDENVKPNLINGCINIFLVDILAFFGKNVEYNKIII
jgi:hypothetical protein